MSNKEKAEAHLAKRQKELEGSAAAAALRAEMDSAGMVDLLDSLKTSQNEAPVSEALQRSHLKEVEAKTHDPELQETLADELEEDEEQGEEEEKTDDDEMQGQDEQVSDEEKEDEKEEEKEEEKDSSDEGESEEQASEDSAEESQEGTEKDTDDEPSESR